MKQLYKLSVIIFLSLSFFSCVADEEEISTQDLLFGKWKTTSYTENGITPNDFTNCDYERTVEFSDNEITFVDFMLDDTNTDCIIDETYNFDYELINDSLFKITRPNGIVLENEILALSSTELKIKAMVNDVAEETTFERIY